jgi:hypothetical protein
MNAAMATRRAYFAVVLGFTAWVGFFAFFRPQEVLRALPWPVPPLHARVIGALYLSATLFLLLSLFARTRLQVRTVVDIAGVWTGWLLLISAVHWRSFDPAREQVWFWAVAYLTFPLAAAALSGSGRASSVPRSALITQRPVVMWLAAQGAALVVLGLLLAALPGVMAGLWPWKISTFLAQIYSGPVLGYGVGSLLLAARRNWIEMLIPTIGMAAFALLALLGSSWHIELFGAGSVSQWLWFGALGLLALVSLVLTAVALRQRHRA